MKADFAIPLIKALLVDPFSFAQYLIVIVRVGE